MLAYAGQDGVAHASSCDGLPPPPQAAPGNTSAKRKSHGRRPAIPRNEITCLDATLVFKKLQYVFRRNSLERAKTLHKSEGSTESPTACHPSRFRRCGRRFATTWGLAHSEPDDKQVARQELKQALKLKLNFECADQVRGLLRSLG